MDRRHSFRLNDVAILTLHEIGFDVASSFAITLG